MGVYDERCRSQNLLGLCTREAPSLWGRLSGEGGCGMYVFVAPSGRWDCVMARADGGVSDGDVHVICFSASMLGSLTAAPHQMKPCTLPCFQVL